MAGNRTHFSEAMQSANDAVWAEQWEDASTAYQRALNEFPNNASALLGYAWTLLNLKDMDGALDAYQQITKITPKDPGPYERIGDILKAKGDRNGAIKAFSEAASNYGKQELTAKQTASLESIISLAPRDVEVWSKLITLYQQQHLIDQSVLAALWVGFLLQETDEERALAALRDMQQFIPHNSQIQHAISAMQRHHPLPEPPQLGAINQLHMVDAELEPDEEERESTPAEIAQQRAMERLAEAIFDEDLPKGKDLLEDEVRLLFSRAVNAHSRGDVDAAIRAYEQLLDANVILPSIQFGLGLLYQEKSRFDDAIEMFQYAVPDPDYCVAGHILTAQCFQEMSREEDALLYYVDAVQALDLSLAKPEFTPQLSRLYDGLAPSLIEKTKPALTKQINGNLAGFLSSSDWQMQARDARRRIDELAKLGTVFSLVELLILSERESVLRGMAIAQEYLRRGRERAAIEETMHIISLAPSYLPLHHLLADLLFETNQLEESIQKYEILARTYEIRDQPSQAITTYNRIIEMSPLDIDVHQRVADLQVKRGNYDEALAQYLQISDAYYQLAQPELARDTYLKALDIAPRGSADRRWEIRILHKMADLDLQRLDWPAAISDNEGILKLDPDDERAHLALYRLYPKTGRNHLAISVLDRFIKSQLDKRKIMPVLAVLEDLIMEEPESIPLRARIAQLYLNTGKRERAMEHLDILGDLQLEAGHKEGAIKTIEAILRLGPDNYDAYADLYRSMTNREPPPPRGRA